MGRINLGRVVLGGLLAGLIINAGETALNLVVAARALNEALSQRNLPEVAGAAIGGFVLGAFALGIVTVWLYAAIRPRFGPGARTAAIAGVAVWLLAYVYMSNAWVLMGVFPLGVSALTALWGLPEILLAAVAGAWLYRE